MTWSSIARFVSATKPGSRNASIKTMTASTARIEELNEQQRRDETDDERQDEEPAPPAAEVEAVGSEHAEEEPEQVGDDRRLGSCPHPASRVSRNAAVASIDGRGPRDRTDLRAWQLGGPRASAPPAQRPDIMEHNAS